MRTLAVLRRLLFSRLKFLQSASTVLLHCWLSVTHSISPVKNTAVSVSKDCFGSPGNQQLTQINVVVHGCLYIHAVLFCSPFFRNEKVLVHTSNTSTAAACFKLISQNLPAAWKRCQYAIPEHTITKKALCRCSYVGAGATHSLSVVEFDTLWIVVGWLHGTAVERRSLADELSCPALNLKLLSWPLMWVSHPL